VARNEDPPYTPQCLGTQRGMSSKECSAASVIITLVCLLVATIALNSVILLQVVSEDAVVKIRSDDALGEGVNVLRQSPDSRALSLRDTYFEGIAGDPPWNSSWFSLDARLGATALPSGGTARSLLYRELDTRDTCQECDLGCASAHPRRTAPTGKRLQCVVERCILGRACSYAHSHARLVAEDMNGTAALTPAQLDIGSGVMVQSHDDCTTAIATCREKQENQWTGCWKATTTTLVCEPWIPSLSRCQECLRGNFRRSRISNSWSAVTRSLHSCFMGQETCQNRAHAVRTFSHSLATALENTSPMNMPGTMFYALLREHVRGFRTG
jgi:hypothetical protein